MKKIRFTALLLLAAAVAANFSTVGCENTATKSKEAVTEDTTAVPVKTEPEDIFSIRAKENDNLPEKDYGGAEFNIATDDYMETDFYVEEANGERLNDVVYQRNQAVEERYNIKIKVDSGDYEGMKAKLRSIIQAGDDTYDLIAQHACTAGTLAIEGVLMNCYDIPYVDFSRPWWSQNAVEALSYKNKVLYLAIGVIYKKSSAVL